MDQNPYESPRAEQTPVPRKPGPLLQLLLPAIFAGILCCMVILFGLKPYRLFGMLAGGIGGFIGGVLNRLVMRRFLER